MSVEYEKAILGAILQDSSLMDCLRLELSMFDDSKNRAIFTAILGLHASGKPIDLLTVSQTLDGSSATVGASYLAHLTDTPTAANSKFYAEQLRSAAKSRGLRHIATELGQDLKDGLSTDELITRTIGQLLELQQKGAHLETVHPREILHEILSDAEMRLVSGTTGLSGVPSGIPRLDLMTGGFQPGDLVLIGARTSVGKSALALSFVEHEIEHGFAAALITLEMSGRQVLERLLAMRSRIGTGRLRLGFLNGGDFGTLQEAAGRIAEQDLRLLDKPGADLATISAWLRAEVSAGTQIAYVDYAGLIGGGDSRVPQWERMSEISHGLKSIARQNRIPLVALVQLGRSAVENGPGLENVRGSGSFEEDADIALFLQRKETGTADEEVPGELIVAKHRNGPTGRIGLLFDRSTTRFREDTIGASNQQFT